MELLLIRHALPVRVDASPGRPADPSLSQEGRGQAERLAGWLAAERIDAVYASPAARAVETALPIVRTHRLELRIEPDIAEFDRDSQSYVPLEVLKAEDYARWKDLVDGGLYAGRDITAFRAMVVRAMERIIAAHPGARVAVVCHGGVINAWTAEVLASTRTIFFEPGYTSLHRFLAASTGERSVRSLNEMAHLRAG